MVEDKMAVCSTCYRERLCTVSEDGDAICRQCLDQWILVRAVEDIAASLRVLAGRAEEDDENAEKQGEAVQ